jgi:hypothetical protein
MYTQMTLGLEIDRLIRRYPANFQKWTFGPTEEFKAALKHFCWIIYQKTSTDGGVQIMGREWDTDPYSIDAHINGRVAFGSAASSDPKPYQTGIVGYEKVGPGMFRALKGDGPEGGLNTSAGARGNVLKMDRWHPTMNDCWVLGGVHRGASFKLVSPRIPDNIYNYRSHDSNDKGWPVVTARELLGLLHYGYKVERGGSETIIVPKDPTLARNSTITDYWDFMVKKTNEGSGIIRELLDTSLKANLHAELLAFDKSKLRHVTRR